MTKFPTGVGGLKICSPFAFLFSIATSGNGKELSDNFVPNCPEIWGEVGQSIFGSVAANGKLRPLGTSEDAPNLGSPRTAQNCAVHAYKIQVFTGSSFFKFRFRHRPFLVLLFASFCQFVAVALSALGFGVIPNKCAGSLLAIQGHCLRGAFGTSKPCLQRL